jgi:hypothetical protein
LGLGLGLDLGRIIKSRLRVIVTTPALAPTPL